LIQFFSVASPSNDLTYSFYDLLLKWNLLFFCSNFIMCCYWSWPLSIRIFILLYTFFVRWYILMNGVLLIIWLNNFFLRWFSLFFLNCFWAFLLLLFFLSWFYSSFFVFVLLTVTHWIMALAVAHLFFYFHFFLQALNISLSRAFLLFYWTFIGTRRCFFLLVFLIVFVTSLNWAC
jgi:hypothetical protein